MTTPLKPKPALAAQAPRDATPPPTKLRRLRVARGWTQVRLSRETGISRPQICTFETTGVFGPGIAARLAKALGVSADELLADRRETLARLAESE